MPAPDHTYLTVFHAGSMSGPARDLKPRLEALGGRHVVVFPEGGAAADYFRDTGKVLLDSFGRLTLPRTIASAVEQARRQSREVRRLRRIIRDEGVDTVLAATTVVPAAVVAGRLEGCTVIVHCGEMLGVELGPRRFFDRALITLMLRAADGIFACSRLAASSFDSSGRARATVTWIYPGIDVADYGSGNAERGREIIGADEDRRPLIVVVGNLTEARGQDVLLEALPAIIEESPSALCVFAGEAHLGPDLRYAERLAERAAELGVSENVLFTGHVETLRHLLAAADVVVNPCRFAEPFGRAAYEALAAERPVVASAAGALPELLEDETTAMLVPVGEAPALARAVRRVLADRELAERLVSNGRALVLDVLDENGQTQKFVEFVGSVHEGRGR